jgi:hypothetical protein
MSTATATVLDRIGVGIDTARYGHRVAFLRPDRLPAAKSLTVLENQAGYRALQQRLDELHQKHPQAHFHIRIDAAGQYATNLELFLRGLGLPITSRSANPNATRTIKKRTSPNAPATIPKARPWHASPSSSNRPPRRRRPRK